VLEALGLTTAEVALYMALINSPRSSVAELADSAELSEQQARHAAQELVRRGLANRLPGSQPRYAAVAPDIALDPLITRREDHLRLARQASQELMAAFRESSGRTHPAELIEIVIGVENIASRVYHLHETARGQLRAFDRPPYAMPPGSTSGIAARRIKEGVSYRAVYSSEAVAWPGRIDGDIRTGCEQGEQARVRPHLPIKLLIIDDRVAFVPVNTGRRDEVEAALLIHPCDLFDALVALFELEWARALPLGSDPGGAASDQGHPDDDTAALLLGLTAGLTDASLARSLGWSLRTTQRHLHRLMDDLGASTRFQAGLEARRRGWA
jgi:Sugar-specific transcriptional regulator TrmB